MKEQAKKYLFDIQSAITSIEQFVGKMNFSDIYVQFSLRKVIEDNNKVTVINVSFS